MADHWMTYPRQLTVMHSRGYFDTVPATEHTHFTNDAFYNTLSFDQNSATL